MTNKSSREIELEKRLQEAEEIIDALRNHKVDAVIGADKITLLRLREAEDQLQEQIQISDKRLKEIESIYQNVPVGLCILDRELRFVRVNDHLAQIHGIPAEEHMGRTMSELLPNMAGKIEEDLHRVIETGKPRMNFELKGKTPARPNVERCLREHWLPLYDQKGEVTGINMVIDEITERKQFEDKLQQLVDERTKVAEQRAEKLREMALQMTQVEEKERQRLARVLHDGLQQLLIGAKFNFKLITKRLKDQDEVRDEIDELNQILDQSIKAARSLSYQLSPPILHDQGLLAALKWLADMPHMKGLHMDIHSDKEIPELSQNLKVFLFQAIRELLTNIIKHADVNEAEVRVSSDEKSIFIEVIDQGKGFDVANLYLNSSNAQGLSTIRERLDLMNGRLKIYSKPGEGSHFTLIVPAEENFIPPVDVEPVQKDPHSTADSTSNYNDLIPGKAEEVRVLVVDDHQVMRDGLVRLLSEEADINIVGEASDGIEAVDIVLKTRPDVVIMDITMPKMNGIEATRQIHEKFPQIQIVGLSMHEEDEYSAQMKEAGAIDLLNKGGPAEQLLAAIRSVND